MIATGIHGPHGDDTIIGGREIDLVDAIVSGSGKNEGTTLACIGDRIVENGALTKTAHRDVDEAGTGIHRGDDALGEEETVGLAEIVGYAHRDDFGTGRHSRGEPAIADDQRSHCRAVTIEGGSVRRHIHQVDRADESLKGGVLCDAGIENGNFDSPAPVRIVASDAEPL